MAAGILERISDIELEMSRTQRNKATEAHLCKLRAQHAKLTRELIAQEEQANSKSGKSQGFEVAKRGFRVVLCGYPSAGKSTLLSTITDTKSEAGAYTFTTLTAISGILKDDNGSEICQIVDLPGLIPNNGSGKEKSRGRSRQIMSTIRTADLILMVLDSTKSEYQRESLERELENVGIRLNKEKPNIYFKKKDTGGIKITFTQPPNPEITDLNEKMIRMLLKEYKIHNCDVLVRDETCTSDDFIDVLNGNFCSYIKCLYAYNKVDAVSLEEVDKLARKPQTVVMSCKEELGLQDLKDEIWYQLNINRVYTKKRGDKPSFDDPLIVRNGSTIQDVCSHIHKDFSLKFKYAMVWGSSAKHSPQKCGLTHHLHDEDVIYLFTK